MAREDVGDEKSVARKLTKSQRIEERELDDLNSVLSTYKGRAFLWKHLSVCGIYSVSFTGDNYTFFKEGKRSVGLELMTEIEGADPYALSKMRDEAIERDLKE